MKRWLRRFTEKRYRLAEKIYNCSLWSKHLFKLYLFVGDVIAGYGIVRWRWEWDGRHRN